MSTAQDQTSQQAPAHGDRPRYRPPIGMPMPKERRIGGTVASLLVHILIVLFIVIDVTHPEIITEALGAGGAGPAGGGGGGNRGTGGVKERVEFVKVRPPAPIPRPEVVPPLVPPKPEPKPKEEEVKPPTPPTEETTASTNTEVTSAVAGTGGGSGDDGSGGSGPGRGGGVGSGIGTGRGTGVGPGTGGGKGRAYPPVPVEVILPPMPIPSKLKGTELVVQFDIDSLGNVLDFTFEPTKDRKYNDRLRDALIKLKFRPAVNTEGVPIRVKYEVTVAF